MKCCQGSMQVLIKQDDASKWTRTISTLTSTEHSSVISIELINVMFTTTSVEAPDNEIKIHPDEQRHKALLSVCVSVLIASGLTLPDILQRTKENKSGDLFIYADNIRQTAPNRGSSNAVDYSADVFHAHSTRLYETLYHTLEHWSLCFYNTQTFTGDLLCPWKHLRSVIVHMHTIKGWTNHPAFSSKYAINSG